MMKKQGRPPKRCVTGKMRSLGAAKRESTLGVERRFHDGLDTHAENSYLPFRKREGAMQ